MIDVVGYGSTIEHDIARMLVGDSHRLSANKSSCLILGLPHVTVRVIPKQLKQRDPLPLRFATGDGSSGYFLLDEATDSSPWSFQRGGRS
jgi:hypothetical protein